MNKKIKSIRVMFCYILALCFIVELFPATAFAKDSTKMTEATKPNKKTVEMTEATKPQKQTTMQVTDVKTKKTEIVDIEEKEEKKEEEKPTTQVTTLTTEESSKQKNASAKNCNGNHTGWAELTSITTPLENGKNYYLTSDLNGDITIPANAKVTLCLQGHTITGSENGSVITVRGDLTLNDCQNTGKITGGKAEKGGGVFVDKNAIFTMNSGVITQNKAYAQNITVDGGTGNGGGIYIDTNGKFTMNSGTITENTAYAKYVTVKDGSGDGGGVFVNGGTFDMEGGTIWGNMALGVYPVNELSYGGGVCAINNSNFTISGNSTIESNTADVFGGGIYIKDSTFIMYDGKISKNCAVTDNRVSGAGVYTSKSEFTMYDGEISENRGTSGGGVLADYKSKFTMKGGIIGSIDTENSEKKQTAHNGAGVYVRDSEFKMENGIIAGNEAITHSGGGGGGGGGVSVAAGTFIMSGNSIITNNIENQYEGSSSSGGGGVCLGGSKFIMSDNSAITHNITNIYGGNSCNGGGGVCLVGLSEFTISDNSTITHNIVNNYQDTGNNGGGGILVNNSIFNMEGGTISNNETNCNGAGVFVTSPYFTKKGTATFTMNGGKITNNKADGNGAGVYIFDVDVNGAKGKYAIFHMKGGEISSNETTNGGGVCVTSGIFTMDSGEISSNKATNGGGVFAGNTFDINSTFTMNGGSVIENESDNAGGGIYIHPSNSTIFNVSNAPIVVDNKGTSEKSKNNVYLSKNKIINVISKLEKDANIGVTVADEPTTGNQRKIAEGSNGYTMPSGDEARFISDNPNYKAVFHDDNAVYLEERPENEKMVTFDYQSNNIKYHIFVKTGEIISAPTPEPTKNGFTFGGWYKDNACTEGKEWHFDTDIVTEDITLYAKWTEIPPTMYTVTFDSQCGSSVAPITVIKDSTITEPTPPTFEGHTFNGWYTESVCTNPYYFNTPITSDITLYAKWTEDNIDDPTPQYTITFDSQGGSSVAPITVTKDSTITEPTPPTFEGHTFNGWYTESVCTNPYYFNTPITSNITLYAKWTKNNIDDPTPQYTITFDSQGGSSIPSQKVEKDKQAIKPTDPIKNGFIFNGWYTDKNCTQAYDFATLVNNNITLYANWKENENPAPSIPTIPTTKYYTVTFESNGGSEIPSQTIASNKTATMPQNPEKNGYEFLGWFADKDFNEVYRFSTPITKNATIYAKWKSNHYIVTFESNGGSNIPSQTIETGKTVTMPENPTKSGYEFLGWFTDENFNEIYRFNTPVMKDITIYAKWKSKSHSSGGGGGGNYRTGTWVKEEPKKQVVTHQIVKPECPRDETCPLWKFTDVDRWAWYHDGSHYCVEHGLIVGTTNTTFSPHMPITRAMIVTILWRIENKPMINDSIPFQDVKESKYYAEAVRWAAHNGIVSGYSNTIFAPDDSITREQMASILYRYTEYKNKDVSGRADISNYKDRNEISNYALMAIQWACSVGMINGIDTTTLSPKGTTTRAQAAQMFKAYLEEQ